MISKMADRRRRRRRASQDSEEDDESGSGSESGKSLSPTTKPRVRDPEPVEAPAVRVVPKNDAESECESEDGVGEAVLSDYESADPEENGSHSEGGEEEEEEEEVVPPPAAEPKPSPAADTPAAVGELQEGGGKEEGEKGVSKEVKCEDKSNLAGERQSGDGQESTEDSENKGAKPGQKLDDDQDRNNPAYIPRKGMFFEHDVRGNAQEEERPKGRNRKLWKDEGCWEHDRFREEEQAPKSREELVAIYGYDIRNGGVSNERSYRQRKPRHSTSPVRDKRWRDGDGERPIHTSWQQGGNPNSRSAPLAVALQQSDPPPSAAPNTQRNNNPPRPSSHPPPRGFQGNRPPQAQYRNDRNQESQRPGPKAHPAEALQTRSLPPMDGERGPRGRGNRGAHTERSPSVVVEEVRSEEDDERNTTTVTTSQSVYYNRHYSGKGDRERDSVPPPRRQEQQRGGSAPPADNPVTRDASPAPERPVEKKSYSLARRTRTRATELDKQASLEEPASTVSSSALTSEPWQGPGQSQGEAGDSSQVTVLTGLDQDLARLSLAGQNWAQNPSSFLRAEMRGIPNSMHMGGAPPQYSNIEELGAGNRAKRYSSQRQRPSPEPAPPMHIGVMESHYYEPMSYQGPIYAHGDSPAPLPPQAMLVQPEMHLPHPGHPGLHPHQSSGPMPNPALYAAPPVSMSPGQPPPQQLLAPPFYPPPGVMTFGNTNYPYPAGATLPPMYNPPAQSQVYSQSQVYGGVTYYDPMQQQAQPKPSPPRRSSQPVTVKPPPPEVGYGPE
nr:protein CASC3 [Salvelinus alpinus]